MDVLDLLFSLASIVDFLENGDNELQ